MQVIAMFGVMGNAILMTQYLQSVLGYSALAAALWSLVPSVVVGAAAPLSAVAAQRVGRPVVMAAGFLVAAAGFVGMRWTGADSGIVPALVASALIAAGLVSVATLVTEYALGVAPSERAGSVSALVETASELGGALGMAVLGSILASSYAANVADRLPAGLPSATAEAAGQGLGDAIVVAERLGGAGGASVLEAARTAYVAGMHVTDLVAAGVLVGGAVVAALLLPRQPAQVDDGVRDSAVVS